MDEEKRFRFTKKERVTGEKRIESLFERGRSFMAYPFRVVYVETILDSIIPLSVLISIPKKRIKSAVDRNRMKRLAREAYRLNKHLFFSRALKENESLDVAFINVADKTCDYATVEKGIRKALRELNHRIEQRNSAENN
ncbi:ribonuclease P protein component [Proteiniphilum sp.]|uniref:ribonuclease P protein component n=1 Tax=Proteiniphilum sp. TaxID=1926877 RepID=UPI002B1FFC49|nr:ribonuclease P protein component [Proteiniphilum sp.]MEA4916470.1 ribonuclease P protein component [Proteiniphilum sp.]